MSYRLDGRITRLEEKLNPPNTGRIFLICVNVGESNQAAVARHCISPGPHDMIVIFRYGKCPGCTNKLR